MLINVIPVEELPDIDLMAEVKEIKLLPKILCKSLRSKKSVNLDDIPTKYTYNKGGVKFFYNKLDFISDRFSKLVEECDNRGYTLLEDERRLWDKNYDYSSIENSKLELWNEYIPTTETLNINRKYLYKEF